jgi:hypothetical protein
MTPEDLRYCWESLYLRIDKNNEGVPLLTESLLRQLENEVRKQAQKSSYVVLPDESFPDHAITNADDDMLDIR